MKSYIPTCHWRFVIENQSFWGCLKSSFPCFWPAKSVKNGRECVIVKKNENWLLSSFLLMHFPSWCSKVTVHDLCHLVLLPREMMHYIMHNHYETFPLRSGKIIEAHILPFSCFCGISYEINPAVPLVLLIFSWHIPKMHVIPI